MTDPRGDSRDQGDDDGDATRHLLVDPLPTLVVTAVAAGALLYVNPAVGSQSSAR